MWANGNSFAGGRLPADSTTEREAPIWAWLLRPVEDRP